MRSYVQSEKILLFHFKMTKTRKRIQEHDSFHSHSMPLVRNLFCDQLSTVGVCNIFQSKHFNTLIYSTVYQGLPSKQ